MSTAKAGGEFEHASRTREPTDPATLERLAGGFRLVNNLISLRLRRAETPEARADLAWLLDVVTALGLLQQRLVGTDPGALAAYLTDLGAFWRRLAGSGAEIEVTAEVFALPEQRAAALALIAHDLVRHAVERSDGSDVRLQLSLNRRGEHAGELELRDHAPAPGAPGDLWLSAGLAEQLGGQLDVTPGRVRFSFLLQPDPAN